MILGKEIVLFRSGGDEKNQKYFSEKENEKRLGKSKNEKDFIVLEKGNH